MSKYIGFTLIEVLVSLAILLSVIAIGVPNLNDFIVRMRVDNEIYHLHRLLLLSRNAAINGKTKVTFCPLNEENKCINVWHEALTVFTDINQNKIFEPHLNEKIIAHKAAIKHDDILRYGNTRNGLTYAETGHLSGWGQNATFSYCPANHSDKNRGIIVAVSGRVYISTLNKQGTANVRRTGAKIACI